MRIAHRAAFLALGTLVAGCASMPRADRVADSAEVRAAKRWELLLAKDFRAAYAFLSPGVRSTQSVDQYQASMAVRPVSWAGAEVVEAACEPPEELCRVSVKIKFDVASPVRGVKGKIGSETVVAERWVNLDGEWYFIPRDVALGR